MSFDVLAGAMGCVLGFVAFGGLDHVVWGFRLGLRGLGFGCHGLWGALVLVGTAWFGLGLLWTDADVSRWSMFLDWAVVLA